MFAGYGIVGAGPSYDDYAGVDVDGKAVVIFSHEPQERQPEQPPERRAAAAADHARGQGGAARATAARSC